MKKTTTLLCLMILTLSVSQPSFASKDEQKLNELKGVIAEQKKTITRQKKESSSLQKELETQEKKISNVNVQLNKNQKQLKQLDAEMKAILADIQLLETQQVEHKKVLKNQIEQAFRLGPTSELELIFNGAESERNERIITYLKYINEARQKTLLALSENQQKREENKTNLEKKATTQKQVITQNRQEKTKLAKLKQDRQKTLNSLNVSLNKNEQRLVVLLRNQQNLQKKIELAQQAAQAKLAREAKEAAAIRHKQSTSSYMPTKDEIALMARASGLGKAEKKYTKPVNGRVLHHFGEPLQGELFWKGIVIGAAEGTPVKAIADGTVLLASWLQGYGFMVVVGHGTNDMSLYGYNQRIAVKINDKVKAGQTLAYSGNSGGQENSALYFEIRRDGRALDPEGWLKK